MVAAPLFVAPSRLEVEGLGPWVEACGVGKSASAAYTASALALRRPPLVVLLGVCGAYPDSSLGLGECVVVERECFGDEGVAVPGAFEPLGFGLERSWCADPLRTRTLARALGARRVVGATVSTCAGTDALALARAQTLGAAVESMEGAAVALACEAAGVPWIQIRAASNRAGTLDRDAWRIPEALRTLRDAALEARRLLS